MSASVFYGNVNGRSVTIWSYNGLHEFAPSPRFEVFDLDAYPLGVLSVSRSPGSSMVDIYHHPKDDLMNLIYRGEIRDPRTGDDRRIVPILRELTFRDAKARARKQQQKLLREVGWVSAAQAA